MFHNPMMMIGSTVSNPNLLPSAMVYDLATNWLLFQTSYTLNASTDPVGGISSDLLKPNTTSNNPHNCYYGGGNTGTANRCFSFYAKAGGLNYISGRLANAYGGTSKGATFDLVNGTVTQTYNSPTTSITDAGNGWWRCSLGASTVGIYVGCNLINIGTPTYSSGGDVSYAPANTTDGVYLWGFKLENGLIVTEL